MYSLIARTDLQTGKQRKAEQNRMLQRFEEDGFLSPGGSHR